MRECLKSGVTDCNPYRVAFFECRRSLVSCCYGHNIMVFGVILRLAIVTGLSMMFSMMFAKVTSANARTRHIIIKLCTFEPAQP